MIVVHDVGASEVGELAGLVVVGEREAVAPDVGLSSAVGDSALPGPALARPRPRMT